jgi:hypothetical protein
MNFMSSNHYTHRMAHLVKRRTTGQKVPSLILESAPRKVLNLSDSFFIWDKKDLWIFFFHVSIAWMDSFLLKWLVLSSKHLKALNFSDSRWLFYHWNWYWRLKASSTYM